MLTVDDPSCRRPGPRAGQSGVRPPRPPHAHRVRALSWPVGAVGRIGWLRRALIRAAPGTRRCASSSPRIATSCSPTSSACHPVAAAPHAGIDGGRALPGRPQRRVALVAGIDDPMMRDEDKPCTPPPPSSASIDAPAHRAAQVRGRINRLHRPSVPKISSTRHTATSAAGAIGREGRARRRRRARCPRRAYRIVDAGTRATRRWRPTRKRAAAIDASMRAAATGDMPSWLASSSSRSSGSSWRIAGFRAAARIRARRSSRWRPTVADSHDRARTRCACGGRGGRTPD